ncbi:MAG: flagellin [bacterium]
MRINTNVSALQASNNLGKTQNMAADSMAKLSSGFRINKAADDAAGLGIANKLRADTRSLVQASRNAEQANSLLGVAEGSANTIQSILERMKELATQAGSDSVDGSGRTKIMAEYTQLRDEIQRTTGTTQFNGVKLLDGTFSNSVDVTSAALAHANSTHIGGATISGVAAGTYNLTTAAASKVFTLSSASVTQSITVSAYGKQNITFDKFGVTVALNASYSATSANVAATNSALTVTAGSGGTFLIGSSGNYTTAGGLGDNITIANSDLTTDTLGITSGGGAVNVVDLSTSSASARTALSVIDAAIAKVSTALGEIGAAQNRVTYGLENAKTAITNFTAAESIIRDVDMADEMTKFSKSNILAQAGTAMLAQANQSGQSVLKLLQ